MNSTSIAWNISIAGDRLKDFSKYFDEKQNQHKDHNGSCGFCTALCKVTNSKIISGNIEAACCQTQKKDDFSAHDINRQCRNIGGQVNGFGESIGFMDTDMCQVGQQQNQKGTGSGAVETVVKQAELKCQEKDN